MKSSGRHISYSNWGEQELLEEQIRGIREHPLLSSLGILCASLNLNAHHSEIIPGRGNE